MRTRKHTTPSSSRKSTAAGTNAVAIPASGPAQLVIQRVPRAPVVTPVDGSGRAVQVDLTLGPGDTAVAGAKPGVSPPGWQGLKDLGLAKGKDKWHKWVRFHLLNKDEGGPDAIGNLPPTTEKANHDEDWLQLEADLTNAANNPLQRPLHFYAFTHYPPSRKVHWTLKRGKYTQKVVTDTSHYPDRISGFLEVGGVVTSSAILSDADGAIAPEDLKKVPYAKAKTASGASITGTKG